MSSKTTKSSADQDIPDGWSWVLLGETGEYIISLGRFSSLAVPVPSREEQEEIMRIFDITAREADTQSIAIDLALKQSAAQRKNILKSTFSGQLVAQDPNDEPASVLLERIRNERQQAKIPVKRSRR